MDSSAAQCSNERDLMILCKRVLRFRIDDDFQCSFQYYDSYLIFIFFLNFLWYHCMIAFGSWRLALSIVIALPSVVAFVYFHPITHTYTHIFSPSYDFSTPPLLTIAWNTYSYVHTYVCTNQYRSQPSMRVFRRLVIGAFHNFLCCCYYCCFSSTVFWPLFVLCVNLIFSNGGFCVFDGFCIWNRNRQLNHCSTAAGAPQTQKRTLCWLRTLLTEEEGEKERQLLKCTTQGAAVQWIVDICQWFRAFMKMLMTMMDSLFKMSTKFKWRIDKQFHLEVWFWKIQQFSKESTFLRGHFANLP